MRHRSIALKEQRDNAAIDRGVDGRDVHALQTAVAAVLDLSVGKILFGFVYVDLFHILEQGTHPELLEANGRYAEFYRLGLTWDD